MFKWDVQRVAAVINAEATEGQSLEFKAELPERNDKGKAEFLKDVSALANASGGAILFGVAEEGGKAESLAGLQLRDPDAEVRRLSQIVESGIEPRLAGIQFATLRLGESDVLVVDVPQSFDAPHRYLFNGHSKFVQRTGTHVSELSYDQLRAAFNRSSVRLERLRREWALDFNFERMWKSIGGHAICVLRVASMLAADGRQVIDPQRATNFWGDLLDPDWPGGSHVYNYEGLVVAPSRDGETIQSYNQVHRTGAITGFCVAGTEWKGERIFIPARAEKFIMASLPRYLHFLRQCGLGGSALISMGISRLGGSKLAFHDGHFDQRRDARMFEIEMPELFVDDIGTDPDFHALLRPNFDLIWQSYGESRCRNYRPDGVWSVA